MRILFEGDGPIEAQPGETLLEAALRHGLPHAHACGGHARYSTCRVAVLDGLDKLAPPTESEQALASARHFPSTIRLACQARPRADGPIRVRRLIRDERDLHLVLRQARPDSLGAVGDERSLAVFFADIRGFTRFGQAHLAYDVVHIGDQGTAGAVVHSDL
jgi:adenylate cyclase